MQRGFASRFVQWGKGCLPFLAPPLLHAAGCHRPSFCKEYKNQGGARKPRAWRDWFGDFFASVFVYSFAVLFIHWELAPLDFHRLRLQCFCLQPPASSSSRTKRRYSAASFLFPPLIFNIHSTNVVYTRFFHSLYTSSRGEVLVRKPKDKNYSMSRQTNVWDHRPMNDL